MLAEASPRDIKWGIGLEADDPHARQRHRWRGRNLLGEVLMEVRDMLANGYDAADISVPHSTIYYTDNFVLVCKAEMIGYEDCFITVSIIGGVEVTCDVWDVKLRLCQCLCCLIRTRDLPQFLGYNAVLHT